MKREVKEQVNAEVLAMYETMMKEDIPNNPKRLRSCSACVFETDRFYILQSYATIVAFIDKETDTLYDVLRYVYGYTSTSAQHISKFSHDYGCGKWGCAMYLRYYN